MDQRLMLSKRLKQKKKSNSWILRESFFCQNVPPYWTSSQTYLSCFNKVVYKKCGCVEIGRKIEEMNETCFPFEVLQCYTQNKKSFDDDYSKCVERNSVMPICEEWIYRKLTKRATSHTV